MADIVERLREVLADDLHTPLPWIGAGPSYGQPLPMELTSVVTDTEPDSECDITICRDAVTPDVELICAAVNAAPVLLAELDRLRAQVAALSAPAPAPAEPVAWMWQHEETGRTGFVDVWQLQNGWRENNPRLAVVTPLYAAPAAPAGWQKPGPVTADHPLECLIVVKAVRQSDGDWWIGGSTFLNDDTPIGWMPHTAANRAAIDGQKETE